MTTAEAFKFIESRKVQGLFSELYGSSSLNKQTERYVKLIKLFAERFGDQNIRIFSSPGRSEISGNHTDHNLGKVLAASIQLDCIGAVAKTENGLITVCDKTYNEDFSINVSDTDVHVGEKGSVALIRGIVQGFKNKGFKTGGFNALFSSNVISSAGVSSSASFEMMICLILNNLYNGGNIPLVTLASIGQFAENAYWNKSSGMLDQTACAFGGLISIDFEKQNEPKIEQIPFDFAKEHYSLVITNTGKGHADLSAEYSSIPLEMKAVAAFFGKSVLREISLEQLTANLSAVRTACGDRAVMRAFHYFAENNRVDSEISTLKSSRFKEFLKLVKESGDSSWKWLQNVFVAAESREQSICVCLALTEQFIAANCPFDEKTARPGVCRVHGGGFAGVIMALIPEELTQKYKDFMQKALGVSDDEKSPVYVMSVRPKGAIEI